jgi:excinuclease ABC subunit A
VLELTVSEALYFFRNEAELVARLRPLKSVGLDYLRLGQPVPTLSGGEAQRLKLAGYLPRQRDRDAQAVPVRRSPTTGLHFDDVAKLLRAFRQLLDSGPLAAGDRAQPRT